MRDDRWSPVEEIAWFLIDLFQFFLFIAACLLPYVIGGILLGVIAGLILG